MEGGSVGGPVAGLGGPIGGLGGGLGRRELCICVCVCVCNGIVLIRKWDCM